MARIDLDLAHAYKPNPKDDSDYALLPLKMTFDDGGAYALLGPSGCGKTTLLNIVSGLLAPSQGSVSFDGRDVTYDSPQQRNIAQVFQFPVIYDTMTVAENLAFPLRNRGMEATRIKQRVGVIAEMLELNAQLDQRAANLAADAKQKISLGRVEALTFAEQVVVMTRGRAVQVGSADALFERPAHTFVGHFIGSPGMNFLPAHAHAGALNVAGRAFTLPATRTLPDGELKLGVRPEYVSLALADAPGALRVTVAQAQDVGTHVLVTGQFDGLTVKARLSPEVQAPQRGDAAWLQVMGPHTCFYKDEELVA